jgi:hypothetical protein
MNALPPLSNGEIQHLQSVETCVRQASNYYRVNTEIYRAIILTEGTQIGQQIKNTNGSIDLSVAGINSINLPELRQYNIDKKVLLENPCVNLMVGAWLLARHLSAVDTSDPKQLWRAIGSYNSQTEKYNLRYQKLVWHNLQRLRAYYTQVNYSFKEMKVVKNN